MQKNEIYTGEVVAYGYNGEGIIKAEQITVFVPFCIVGETISYKILKVQKNIAYGKIVEIIKPSQYRQPPKCSVFTKCGGCQLQHLAYSEQLKLKEQLVRDCFKKIAGLEVEVNQTIASPLLYEYRNKLQLPIRREGETTQIGFYANNSHRIIEIDKCPLHENWAERIIKCLKQYIEKSGVICYNEKDNKGSLRHVVVRKINNEFIFVLVTTHKNIKIEILTDILRDNFDNFSLYINENKQNNNVILGDKFSLVYGKGFITDTVFGINFDVGAESFVQINNEVKNKLYSDIKALVGKDEDTFVIDAYSGVGLLTAIIAKDVKKAFGVEIVQEAVESANNLAKRNGLEDKMVSYCGKCEDILPNLIKSVKGKVKIVVDPPRKGVDKGSLIAMRDSQAEEIIYCSCSPQTLARDIGIILGTIDDNGRIINNPTPKYTITSIQPYDMFPNTKHVETIVSLCKQ